MSEAGHGESFAGSAPENYERYFVPAIGAPVAEDLIEAAALCPGERVLDVACGTGVVTRLAKDRVGAGGTVAGSDVSPDMVAVARSLGPESIDWYETGAEAMPLPDQAFDVVLCQMGLQFFQNKLAGLREIHRVLAPGGRLVLSVPGPTPQPLSMFADALARHVAPEAAGFVHIVFSLHDQDELRDLLGSAGFGDVDVQSEEKPLRVPPPKDFMWQYIHSTPMAGVLAEVSEETRGALERDVCAAWEPFVEEGALAFSVRMTTAIARKT